MDPAVVETVFGRVEQAIADLLNIVKAIEWRDRLKAVAAAAVLDRHDIRAAAARAVAEVERWSARQARSPTSGRQAAEDGREPNLGRRPTFPQATCLPVSGAGTLGAYWQLSRAVALGACWQVPPAVALGAFLQTGVSVRTERCRRSWRDTRRVQESVVLDVDFVLIGVVPGGVAPGPRSQPTVAPSGC